MVASLASSGASGAWSSMSPVMIVTFSERRSVSVGLASGLGCTASARNVGAQEASPAATAAMIAMRAHRAVIPGSWRNPSPASIAVVRPPASSLADEPAGMYVSTRGPVALDQLGQLAEWIPDPRPVDRAEPPGQVDRPQDRVGARQIVVDDQVVILVEMGELLERLAEPALDHVVGVG